MITTEDIKIDSDEMEVDFSWALERRKSYLVSEIALRQDTINKLVKELPGKDSLNRELILKWMKEDCKEIQKLERDLLFLKPEMTSKSGITNNMILKAKNYPIIELLQNNASNDMTNCVAHQDRTPSMSIKNNRAHCFSCGFKGDTIDIYMKLHKVDFKTAVKILTKGTSNDK